MAWKIFISYRRADTDQESEFLAEVLRRQFGDDRVFFDRSGSLDLGREWSLSIDEALRQARVTLVVIGAQWLDELTKRAAKDAEENRCRGREVEQALLLLPSDARRRVISVRVDPRSAAHAENDLPERLRLLVKLQGTSVREDHQSHARQDRSSTRRSGQKTNVWSTPWIFARSLPVRTIRARRRLTVATTIGIVLAVTGGAAGRGLARDNRSFR